MGKKKKRTGKPIETESRLRLSRAGEGIGKWEVTANGHGVYREDNEMFQNRLW